MFKSIDVGKYLTAMVTEVKPKTVVQTVRNKHHGDVLGQVRWFPLWRQYCYKIELAWLKEKIKLLPILGVAGYETETDFDKGYAKGFYAAREAIAEFILDSLKENENWYSESCLRDIADFLHRQNEMHKALSVNTKRKEDSSL